MEMKVDPDTTLLLFGEADAVIEGYAEVYGKRVTSVHVPEGKVYPLYFRDEGRITTGGDIIQVKGNTIPESWKKFSEGDYRRIFTFGGTDTGKSSFCVYIMNKMGIDCAVDADIGQNDIVHPGAMAAGFKKEKIISLSELEKAKVSFVGAISPSGFESRCLKAFHQLCRLAREKAVVNTTGWINGRKAREYKLSKIEIFNPDVVAALDSTPYYIDDIEVFRLESFVIRKRGRDLRAIIRRRNYEKWLDRLDYVEKSADELCLKNTTLFRGEEIRDPVLESFGDVVYCERGYDFLNIYSENYGAGSEAVRFLREYFGVSEVNIIKPSELEGLVLGLKKGDSYLSMGLLKEIDFQEKILRFLGLRDIDTVEFGSFRLDEDKREVVVRVP